MAVKLMMDAASVIGAMLVAVAPATEATADFQVGGVSLAMPMPAGYCLPSGAQVGVAQVVAAADTTNVTVLTLFRCGGALPTSTGDYTLIKVPRSALMVTVDRPTLLVEMGKQFDDPATVAAIGNSPDNAGKSLSETMGVQAKLTGTLAPRGRDDVCAYMGGIIHLASAVATYDQPVGTCITAVGGRVVTIHRYGTQIDGPGVLKLMREARAIAVTIRAASGA